MLISKKEPAFGNLENSQCIQIIEDTNIKFSARKLCSGEKAKPVGRQAFTEEIRRVTLYIHSTISTEARKNDRIVQEGSVEDKDGII